MLRLQYYIKIPTFEKKFMNIKNIFAAFAALLCAIQANADSPEKGQGYILAIYAADLHGRTVAELNKDYPMIPASTMKTVTTGLALEELGADFRFETSLAYSGTIDSLGTLHGDLYIVGGADPTLGTTRVKRDSVFGIWHEAVKAAGIDSIAGNVIGDDRLFPDEIASSAWEWGDLGTYYGAGASGLSFHENSISLRIIPADRPGEKPRIEQMYPLTPWMEMKNLATTGQRRSANSIYLYTSEVSPVSELRGSYPSDGGINVEECCNKYPAMTCAYDFDRYLASKGINSLYGAIDTRRFATRPQSGFNNRDSLEYIVTTFSAPLSYIVSRTNKESNNMYAETLFKMTGLSYCGSATYEASRKTASAILKKLGIDTEGYRQIDGSGLSRQNLVSPEFMCRFLAAIAKKTYGKTFIESLPSPGKEGTLKYFLRDIPADAASRVKAKSGSMSGVRCYAGYIAGNSPDDMIVFAIMSNGNTGKGTHVQKHLEKIIMGLLEQ